MHVLHVTSNLDTNSGGPALALLGLAMEQVKAGMQVTVVGTYYEGADRTSVERIQASGVDVLAVGPARGKLARHPKTGEALRSAIAAADIVHIHALWEDIQHRAARICRQLDKPYVFRPCGMLDPWSLTQGRWGKRLLMSLRVRSNLRHAIAVHFTSQIEQQGAERLRLGVAKIVEPNGIDLREFAELPAKGAFRASYPELADRPVILFLSRIDYKKGLDLLIPAFAAGAPPEAMLVLAGPDLEGYSQHVHTLLDQYGVCDRTLITGMLRGRKRIEALADADLFVLPSYQENFGIAVVEALAAGIPVVISDQVAIWRELQAAGVAGVVPTAVEPLVVEMRRWLSDPDLRQRAGERARAFAFAHYGWDAIARRWITHYQKLVETSERARKAVER